MSQEDFPVEFVLESIESIMPPSKQPKVLLFDIGGVCVASPLQAILDYEMSHDIPPGWVNYSISKTKPNGFWHRLERGELPMDTTWIAGFTSDLHNPTLWKDFYTLALSKNPSLPTTLPPLPTIDGDFLFWEMMRHSRDPDPWMFPALKSLKKSGKYIIAALSNTVIFPPDHEYSKPGQKNDVRTMFDVFVSSAHIGLRKPDPAIYKYTVDALNKYSQENNKGIVTAADILFLDDIGENLKAAKKAGFETVKVELGRTFEAVDVLEDVTGLKLAGDHPRIAIKPVIRKRGKVEGSKL